MWLAYMLIPCRWAILVNTALARAIARGQRKSERFYRKTGNSDMIKVFRRLSDHAYPKRLAEAI